MSLCIVLYNMFTWTKKKKKENTNSQILVDSGSFLPVFDIQIFISGSDIQPVPTTRNSTHNPWLMSNEKKKKKKKKKKNSRALDNSIDSDRPAHPTNFRICVLHKYCDLSH